MMRPLLGKAFEISAVDDQPAEKNTLTPYPNPLKSNTLHFQCEGKYADAFITRNFRTEIHSLTGSTVFSAPFKQTIEIGPLSPGLYIIIIKNEEGQIISVSKLIKN